MPKGFTEKETLRIRQKLLETGLVFLKQYGVQKTTVDDLTHAVSISKGAFYHFFPSKETLFFCILDKCEKDLKINFLNLLSNIDSDDIKNNLRNILKKTMYSEDFNNYFVIIRKEELQNMLKIVDPEIINNHLEDDRNFFVEMFKILFSKGIKVKADPDTIQAYATGLFALYFEKQIIDTKYFDTIIDSYLDMFIDKIL